MPRNNTAGKWPHAEKRKLRLQEAASVAAVPCGHPVHPQNGGAGADALVGVTRVRVWGLSELPSNPRSTLILSVYPTRVYRMNKERESVSHDIKINFKTLD